MLPSHKFILALLPFPTSSPSEFLLPGSSSSFCDLPFDPTPSPSSASPSWFSLLALVLSLSFFFPLALSLSLSPHLAISVNFPLNFSRNPSLSKLLISLLPPRPFALSLLFNLFLPLSFTLSPSWFLLPSRYSSPTHSPASSLRSLTPLVSHSISFPSLSLSFFPPRTLTLSRLLSLLRSFCLSLSSHSLILLLPQSHFLSLISSLTLHSLSLLLSHPTSLSSHLYHSCSSTIALSNFRYSSPTHSLASSFSRSLVLPVSHSIYFLSLSLSFFLPRTLALSRSLSFSFDLALCLSLSSHSLSL